MKSIYILNLLALLFSINICKAQQLVQKPSDINKLKLQESIFVNKPLKNLIKEIKPQIVMVTGWPSKSTERLGYFVFRFVDKKSYDSTRKNSKTPYQITVFIKETFQWNNHERNKDQKLNWTNSDTNKYGNLTVVGIKISGEQ